MLPIPEKLASANKAAVEAAIRYSQIVFDSAERLLDLNMKVAKSVLADNAKNIQVLTGAKNLQELIALRQSIAQPAVEKMIAYSKGVYEVAAETHAELQSFVETHTSEANKNVAALLDKVVKSAPAGSEAMQAAVKSAMNAANSAYDTMSKAAKQVAEMAEANVAAAAPGYDVSAKKKAG